MALVDPKTPLRSDLERMCGGNQRLVKAFEKLFQVLPTIADANLEAIEAAQITADNATTQAFLAIALIESVNQLAELVSTQPLPTCSCAQYEDLNPRSEYVQQDTIIPSYQLVEPMNLNLEVS